MENTVEVVPSKDNILEAAIADYLGRLDRGEHIGVEEIISAHPGCEAGLREFLQKERRLQLLATGSRASQHQAGQIIGDFRVIRELGRGGMGVVYEAEQLSLGRRVALKILPFAAMLDKQQLARFKNEARAAALLEHPHIVAVHSIGSDGDVHYYAMQLIAGRSLAQVIATLRRGNNAGSSSEQPLMAALSTDDRALSTGVSKGVAISRQELVEPYPGQQPLDQPLPLPEYGSRDYFRAVARLGSEAATALDYAHQSGVLHRDIKPANLLLDDSTKLWIADFGLARLESDASLTGTGDMLGTLRYMAPEQALAKRAVVDHRSDVYSLGATLYELLTLQPGFSEPDPALLLQRIANDEPPAPRQLNPHIPRDLATIVLKAMRKSVQERYSSAQDLADDLQNFLDDKPINAKRPTPLAIVRHWSRRHRPLVWASVATLVFSGLVVAASVGWTARDRAARQVVVDTTANIAIEEAQSLIEKRRWSEALAAVKRAEDVLMGQPEGPLSREAAALRKDIEMVVKLDQIPDADRLMLLNEVTREHFDKQYLKYFREYGVDIEVLDTETAAARIRSSSIPLQLAHDLDKWGTMRRRWPDPSPKGKPLLDLARLVDPDPVRNRIRDALMVQTKDGRKQAFDELSTSLDSQSLPLRTMLLLAHTVSRMSTRDQAIKLLRAIQHQLPGEFEVNFELGYALLQASPPRYEEALNFYTAAAALRPNDSQAREELGIALTHMGLLDDAIAELFEANRLKPNSASIYTNFGVAYFKNGLKDKAIEAFAKAIRLDAGDSFVYHDPYAPNHNLGVVLSELGRFEEAIAAFREAICLKPDSAVDHASLGNLLQNQGLFDQAIPEYRQAIELGLDTAAVHGNLGIALADMGQTDDALEHFQIAVRLDPTDVKNFVNLGMALDQKGLVEEGIAAYRAAAELEPSDATVRCALGLALLQTGQLDGAIASYREALRFQPGMAEHHKGLSHALYDKGLADEANVEFQTAVALYRQIIQDTPNNSYVLWNLARMLANCPNSSFRNPQEAVELANKAVELTPDGANGWSTLGIAHYRAGHFDKALDALQKGQQLNDDDIERLFYLAMAEWQLGNREEARKWYDKGREWMTQHSQVVGGEVPTIRAETEELLSIEEPPIPEVDPAEKTSQSESLKTTLQE